MMEKIERFILKNLPSRLKNLFYIKKSENPVKNGSGNIIDTTRLSTKHDTNSNSFIKIFLFLFKLLINIRYYVKKFVPDKFNSMNYWENRAEQHGRRAVLNLSHSDKEYDKITESQIEILFPLLKPLITEKDSLILDLGCGPGRFTVPLSKEFKIKVIGVDPIQKFLDIAPKYKNVEYRKMKANIIPVKDHCIDVMWICLVLGGITDDKMVEKTINEIKRVLRPDGKIFLVENTTNQHDVKHWKYRAIEQYLQLFNFMKLEHVTDYYDLDERISIMVGKP